MSPRPAAALALVLALAGVAACGRRGDLEQPAPLFNERARADFEARQAAERQAQEDQRNTAGTTGAQPSTTAPRDPDAGATQGADQADGDQQEEFRRPREDLRDPSQRLDPISRAPVEGGAVNDPVGAPPAVRP